MVAIALNFIFVCKLCIKTVIFVCIWLFPVESRVGYGNDFYILEAFTNTADFISSSWDVDRIALLRFFELLHVFRINNMVLSEVIARGNNANYNCSKFVLTGNIFLIAKNLWKNSDSIVKILDAWFNLLFAVIDVVNCTNDIFAFVLKMELRHKFFAVI